MNDVFIGQLLAIVFLVLAMGYMVGGKGLSAKMCRGALKRIKGMLKKTLKWGWKQCKALLRWTWNKIRP